MALSVLLRNSIRTAGLASGLRLTPNVVNSAAKFTQFAKPNLVSQKCANFKILTSAVQKLSVTPPTRAMSQGHSHAFMWTVERFLSAGLLVIIPSALLLCHPVTDNIFAVAIAAHSHWGTECIVMDYIRPLLFGNIIPKIALFIVYCCSTAVLGGLLYYNYNDIGIGNSLKRIWATKKQ